MRSQYTDDNTDRATRLDSTSTIGSGDDRDRRRRTRTTTWILSRFESDRLYPIRSSVGRSSISTAQTQTNTTTATPGWNYSQVPGVLPNVANSATPTTEYFLREFSLRKERERAKALATINNGRGSMPAEKQISLTGIVHDGSLAATNGESSLQQEDEEEGGKQAWLFMLSACLIEAFLWGFTTSYGIFLKHYQNLDIFQNSSDTVLSTVGPVASGIPFLGAPLITILVTRFPHFQQKLIWLGTMISVGSLIGASFAKKDWQLLLSQGVGYGIGVLVVYYPMLSMVNSWFIRRRGLAYGVLFAAAGAAGTGLPFLVEFLLEEFGFHWTLRGYAGGLFILSCITLPFCRGRIHAHHLLSPPNTPFSINETRPVGEPMSNEKKIPSSRRTRLSPDWRILRNPSLYIVAFSTLAQGLAYYIPSLYLPLFSSTILDMPNWQTTLLVAVLNGSQVLSQILLGFISDSTSVFMLIPLSTLGAAVWAIVLWYFNHDNVASIFTFSALFGLFTGGFSSLWARFAMTLSDDQSSQELGYSVLAVQRGIGNIVAGPISVLLLGIRSPSWGGYPSEAPGDAFGSLSLFVGLAMAVAGIGGAGICFARKKPSKRDGQLEGGRRQPAQPALHQAPTPHQARMAREARRRQQMREARARMTASSILFLPEISRMSVWEPPNRWSMR